MTTIPTKTARLHRRSLLRGVSVGAGAGVLGPLVAALESEARGAVTATKRVVFFLSGNGFLTSILPRDVYVDDKGNRIGGKPTASKLVDVPFKELASTMKPLEAYRDRMLVIDDANNGLSGGHYQKFSPLSATRNAAGDQPGGKTIDVFLSERFGAAAPISHLAAATVIHEAQSYVQNVSAFGAGRPVTMVCRPQALSRLLFGGGATSRRDQWVMDNLLPDIKRAAARLAGSERVKLEQYVSAVEQVQRRQRALETARMSAGAMCKSPTLPPEMDLKLIETRAEAQMDLVAAALACRMTQVVTVTVCAAQDFGATYTRLGYTMDLHGIGHGGKDPKMGGDGAIHTFHAGLIARLADLLRAIPEGDGTMFDNTVIVWTNDNGTSHHSRPWDSFRMALIGNAGSALKADGRYLRFPGASGDRNFGGNYDRHLGDIWTTLAHAVGVKVDHFNPDTPQPKKGVVAEMLV